MLRGHCHDSETRKNCEEFSLLAASCALAGLPSANVIHHIHARQLIIVVHAREAALQMHAIRAVAQHDVLPTWWSLVLRAQVLVAVLGPEQVGGGRKLLPGATSPTLIQLTLTVDVLFLELPEAV